MACNHIHLQSHTCMDCSISADNILHMFVCIFMYVYMCESTQSYVWQHVLFSTHDLHACCIYTYLLHSLQYQHNSQGHVAYFAEMKIQPGCASSSRTDTPKTKCC